MKKYIPNALTIARIILVPAFMLFVLHKNYSVALIIFLVASITDFFDGFLARKFKNITNIGKILDPLADKILVTIAFISISLLHPSVLPFWVVSIVIFREIAVTLLREIYAKKKIYISASFLGKLKTFCQMTCVIAFLLYQVIIENVKNFYELESYFYWFFLVAAFFTVLSGLNFIFIDRGKR